ncbi:MAG: hypothetical protein LBB88_05390 [Planctomycetaceae bacterium]|nr:hypothetical protein [Planctomycetaceae bacterium]
MPSATRPFGERSPTYGYLPDQLTPTDGQISRNMSYLITYLTALPTSKVLLIGLSITISNGVVFASV